jgi:hypothetical protein
VSLNKRLAGNMQVDHGCIYIGVTKQLFNGHNIDTILDKMCCITVTKGMKIDCLIDTSLFQSLMHDPANGFGTVTTVRLLAIEKVFVWFFRFKVFSQSTGDKVLERKHAVL